MWDGGNLGRRTRLQGGPGKPWAHLDVPRRVLEVPWTLVSLEVLRTSPVLPGLSGRPRSSPEFPWGFLGFRTSQRLLPASPGRPDVPGASPGLPRTSGLSREVTRGSLKSLTLARSPTDRHDRPYPSGQRSSGRASTPKACFGICSLVRNFCSRAPPRWSIMVGSESGKLVCWSYFVRHRAVSARQAPPEHSQTGSSQRHGGLGR